MGVSGWDPRRPAPLEEDIVKCVACGLCLPHCPTFRLTGRETASPRGRIAAMRAVDEGLAEVDASFTTMMDECLACRACEAACPSGVPFGRMIEGARAQAEPTRDVRARGVRRVGLAWVLPRPRLVFAAGWALAVARALRLDRLAPAAQRASTPPASIAELRRPVPAALGSGPEASVLAGCVMDVAFRPVQRATMRVVAESGYRAVRTRAGGCCGALAMHYGQPDAARAMARARIPEMESGEVVVVNGSGCSAHVRTYGELLADDPDWAERAERVAGRVRDLIELSPPVRDRGLGVVAVHDACHHLHAQRIEPRAMLRDAGAQCTELGDGGRCCGAAGLYSVLQPEMSAQLRRQKAEAIAATGAPVVASRTAAAPSRSPPASATSAPTSASPTPPSSSPPTEDASGGVPRGPLRSSDRKWTPRTVQVAGTPPPDRPPAGRGPRPLGPRRSRRRPHPRARARSDHGDGSKWPHGDARTPLRRPRGRAGRRRRDGDGDGELDRIRVGSPRRLIAGSGASGPRGRPEWPDGVPRPLGRPLVVHSRSEQPVGGRHDPGTRRC